MNAGDAPTPFDDALLAARLFIRSPLTFGGMVLRGSSPARDALVKALSESMRCRKMPGHVDDERLLGGIDIAASLAAGKPVEMRGLLAEAAGGALIVPMAERLSEAVAGRLAQALDDRQVALILLDDGIEPEDAPPPSITERLAFHCDLALSREWEVPSLTAGKGEAAPLCDDDLNALAATAATLGVQSLRPLIFASEAARVHAALSGRKAVERDDLEAAARLVLAPRAMQLPPMEPEADQPEEPPLPRPTATTRHPTANSSPASRNSKT